jgi:hypothetical protein
VVLLHALVNRIVDRFDLAIGAPGADHEVVGVPDDVAEVELDDLERLAVLGVGGDGGGDVLGGQRYIPFSSM